MPAGLGDPRCRRARHPGVHARAGRRARRRAATSGCCSVRPPSWAGRPRCAATTSAARCWAAGSTWSVPSSSPSRWSPTGCPAPGRAPRRTPPGWPAWPGPRRARLPVVLSNAVRFADRLDAPTTDVLDAARRLVPMDLRHLDRRNAEGFLKSGKQMHEVAEEICRYAGLGEPSGRPPTCSPQTRAVADQCVLDPRADLGIGEVHFPEFEVAGVPRERGAASRRRRCARADAGCEVRGRIGWRFGDGAPPADLEAARRRARDRSARSATRRTSSPSATSPR